ncbi:MAG: Mediator of RNA polymerase II transcription subunit 6 [Bogoriella megaspora]|nr:MAG: Mediator of RNA polymerase II transcription subunit 6 [Bogoriella megaspora]
MATAQEPALDETVWSNPFEVQRLGGINHNTLHFYFAGSPFFDRSSKNGSLLTQAQFNPSMSFLLFNRDALERRLKEMPGIEYLIAEDTKELKANPSNEANGIWIVRKQNRKSGSINSEIEVLGTYFIVGDNVFMASSLSDMVNNRLLTSTLAINKILTSASKLPIFTPRTGFSYYAPSIKPPSTTRQPSQSAAPSREASPNLDTASQTSTNAKDTTTSSTSKPTRNGLNSRSLITSFNLSRQHGGEYMDENPLRGEPGSFTFSSTTSRVQAERAAAAARRDAPSSSLHSTQGLKVQSPSPFASIATGVRTSTPTSPPPSVSDPAGKGGGGATNTTATAATAGAGTSPVEKPAGTTPAAGLLSVNTGAKGKDGKRRKSKTGLSPISPGGGQEMT